MKRTPRTTADREAISDIERELGTDDDLDKAPLSKPRSAADTPAGWVYPGEERGYAVAVMGGAQRAGSWEPPETLYVLAFMGGVKLDFREAELLEGVTRVHVLAFMGGVSIIVPRDLAVEVNGIGFMGGFGHLNQHPRHADDSDEEEPLLKISGLAFMGGVEVKVR